MLCRWLTSSCLSTRVLSLTLLYNWVFKTNGRIPTCKIFWPNMQIIKITRLQWNKIQSTLSSNMIRIYKLNLFNFGELSMHHSKSNHSVTKRKTTACIVNAFKITNSYHIYHFNLQIAFTVNLVQYDQTKIN